MTTIVLTRNAFSHKSQAMESADAPASSNGSACQPEPDWLPADNAVDQENVEVQVGTSFLSALLKALSAWNV